MKAATDQISDVMVARLNNLNIPGGIIIIWIIMPPLKPNTFAQSGLSFRARFY